MKRVFIQAYCRYPRGGALANYIENLSKAITYAEYSVVLVSDINEEYDLLNKEHFGFFSKVYPIQASSDEDVRQKQKEEGYATERIEALMHEKIDRDDVVIVLGLLHEGMLERLFKYRDEVGFKVICGVLELFELKDYSSREMGQKRIHVRDEIYIKANAILSISKLIDKHYQDKGVKTYKLPPMIDVEEGYLKKKELLKKRFIIASSKDSLKSVMKAFASLEKTELEKIEIHILLGERGDIKRDDLYDEFSVIKDVLFVYDWLRYEDVLELYKNMHFLLVAREKSQRTLANFPSKVPECMSRGIVPLVSEVGDYTKFYLKNRINSIFMQGDSVENIVGVIREACALSEEQFNDYAKNAFICAQEKFDYRRWKEDIKKMLKLSK